MSFHCKAALVTLATFNLDVMVSFYTGLLGQKPQPYLLNVYAEFQLPGLQLGIFRPKATQEPEFAGVAKSAMSLCLEVDDLEGAIAHLAQLKFPTTNEILVASHGREIYAKDPDGNRLILHSSTLRK